MRASLRVWSQVGFFSQLFAASIINIKDPVAQSERFDGWENHKLLLDNYNSGPAAPYNSWVLLAKEE